MTSYKAPEDQRRVADDLCNGIIHGNRELVRDAFRRMFLHRGTDPNYPHDVEYYEDFAEVLTDFATPLDQMIVLIGGQEYEAETPTEMSFLAWMRQMSKRGLDFEQAFLKARERIVELGDFENLVYELGPEDERRVALWVERLTVQGVEEAKAQEMAANIVRVIRQGYLLSLGEEILDEIDQADREKRRVVLEKITP